CSEAMGFAALAPIGATSASAAAAAIAATYDPLDIRTISVAFFRTAGGILGGHRGKTFVNRLLARTTKVHAPRCGPVAQRLVDAQHRRVALFVRCGQSLDCRSRAPTRFRQA